MGVLVLSHYKIELSSGSDNLLSQNSKSLLVRRTLRHWKDQLWRGGGKNCEGTIEPSEQDLPYEYRHFIRLFELADLVSIEYGECTEIQDGSEDHQISIQVMNDVLC